MKDPVVKPHLLIDASIYIFQYYFSMPDNWFSREGYPTAAVYGYTTFLLRLLETEKPNRIAACFDESLGSCFRNQIYSGYKASRPPADELLAYQIEACREVTEILGIKTFASDKYEADDLIGSLVKRLRKSPVPIAILTRDKDLGQLVLRQQDYLWDYAKDDRFDEHGLFNRFGVHPHQLADYLALVGDAIDDIPGVPGVGPKSAVALLSAHGCIDGIFNNLTDLCLLPVRGAKRLAEKLSDYKDQIYMARELTRIVDNIELGCSVSELNWRNKRLSEDLMEEFFERMGFPRLVTKALRLKNI